jgi:hypothetical protein
MAGGWSTSTGVAPLRERRVDGSLSGSAGISPQSLFSGFAN